MRRALAPRCFADLLDVPVPEGLRGPGVPERLCDLDEASCRDLGPATADDLRGAILSALRPARRVLDTRRLPALPEGVVFEELPLSARARNVLLNTTWSMSSEPVRLEDVTFGQLLRAKNCGWKSALEIAATFESAAPRPEAGTLEDELAALVAGASDRAAAIALRQLGWDGEGGVSYEGLGRELGVSRERVRQLVLRAVGRARWVRPRCPRLAEALAIATAAAPAPARTVAEALAEAGVARKAFDPRGVMSAARVLAIDAPIAIVLVDSIPMVVPAALRTSARPVARLAGQIVRRDGVGRLAELVASSPVPLDSDVARAALSLRPDCRWLDPERTWFFAGEPSVSPLVRHAAKAFAGSRRITASALERMLVRSHHLSFARVVVPPPAVLLELFGGLEAFGVREQTIEAREDAVPPTVLRSLEHLLLQILREHGPLLAVSEIERIAREHGFRARSLAPCLPRVPFLVRYGRGVYGLIDELVAQAFVTVSAPGHGLRGFRKGPGEAALAQYELTGAIASIGAFRLPPEMSALPRRARLVDRSGETAGTFVAEVGLAVGLRPWLERAGARVGDSLRVRRQTRAAPLRVVLGDDDAGSAPP